MTPIRPLTPLQRLAWIEDTRLACTQSLTHPDGTLMFQAGESYPVLAHLTKVIWREEKTVADGSKGLIECSGFESAFRVTDRGGTDRWFVEHRLGRQTEITPLSDHDFNIQELLEHFEIPDVPDLAVERKAEYEAAKERILCLTRS